MLKTENLSVGYGNNIIVKNINLDMKEGEILCIIGPNGAGKSTLLKTIATYLKPKNGAVYLDGKKIHELTPSQLAKEMAIVLTERVNPGNMTGFDIIAIGRHPYTDLFGRLSKEDKDIVVDSAKSVNAEYLLHKNFFEMSDGERQKIMIARALAQEPEILILDEPTSYLDAKHKIELTLLLRELSSQNNLAIIVTLHDIELALRIADKMALIKNHEILAFGYPENVMSREVVNNLYDLDNANYGEYIGYFELKNKIKIKNKKVFIVCGGGTGAPVLRYLVKNGYEPVVGVLHKNDADYFIAENMGIDIIAEEAYDPISYEKFEKAKKEIDHADAVVYTKFPSGKTNILNNELVEYAKNKYMKSIFYESDISVLKDI
ncbi:ABC transporter ATP-binding protein [Methanococcus aeolicus]|uniref:ABC transporter related n=1 Tax=Methanococcus aeolicus (strain ATCC BAA-1280 / DSM 17508 / OCM 812 / Nankai-3) TaxID=419665 RepID=A6UT82_META3|nr:ABC transporter ATP-binding protein [Methanococcus aeolicus]ABR55704.1 ABC transporter related [Methanococcus aeolicus Nankai-3]UXM85199.1 ABC transporter ATP-binding protein [Methanococcus aeolicus]